MNVQKSDKKRNNYDLIAKNFIKVTNFMITIININMAKFINQAYLGIYSENSHYYFHFIAKKKIKELS